MLTMTVAEFQAAVRAQGVPPAQVTFECPRCHTLQCAQDLIDATLADVEGFIGFSCIGRFTDTKGCNWTLGGLFAIHELEIIDDNGKAHPSFMLRGR